MKIRFLADANFNQKIVAGLLLREPQTDFELPQDVIPEEMDDLRSLNPARRGAGSGWPEGRLTVAFGSSLPTPLNVAERRTHAAEPRLKSRVLHAGKPV